jgi:hypothetical protein
MRSRTIQAIVAATFLLALFTVPVFAQSAPIAGCPTGFHLHELGDDHDGEAHFHVGTEADQNGDGWVCARHVSVDASIHVHIDNAVSFV